MISTKPTSMHEEHRYWESEITMWRADLRAWQQELAKAQSEIKLLESALSDHAQVLRLHGSSLRLNEQEFDTHEHAIAEFEKGGEGDELFEMASRQKVDLIVVGTHQRHGLGRVLLGSVSRAVLHHAKVAVAIIAPAETAGRKQRK